MAVSASVEGLDDLRRVVRKVADKDIADQLKTTNKSAAQIVVDDALPHFPFRTGRAKATVKALGSQKSGRAQAGGARTLYLPAIHWGRRRGNVGSPPGNRSGVNVIAGRPVLWESAQRNETKVADQYAGDLDKVMDAIRRLHT